MALAAKRNHPQISEAVQKLEARHIRLLQFSKSTAPASQSPAARVYQKLDAVDYKSTVRIEDLSYECMEIISNAMQLISILLHWACSCYRNGSHRIYLATRLLRRWSHLGADVYEGIVSYLQNMTWVHSGDLRVLLRIVAELVRSKHFSAGRYLQWLIATGSLESGLDLASVSQRRTRCSYIANMTTAFCVASTPHHRVPPYWAVRSSPQLTLYPAARQRPLCRYRRARP